jgi:integrase
MGSTFYRKGRGAKSWVVVVRWRGERHYKLVASKQDAEDLVRRVHKQELAGINVVETIRQARAQAEAAPVVEAVILPTLRAALPEWIERQERAGEIRVSTGLSYRSRLTTWVYPHPLPDGRQLGDLPINAVTREQIGAVIRRARESRPQRMATARALFPRWAPFILTGLLTGLRWGESAALYATDIDWKRGRLHVQRTWSDKAGRIEAPKDHEGRHVKASPALLAALRAHLEAVTLEGQVKGWTPEQRQLVFPNKAGRIMQYSSFLEGPCDDRPDSRHIRPRAT